MSTLASLCLVGMCLVGFAQTNSSTVLSTNYVTARPDFRRVGGQLFNVEKSQLWKSLDLEFIRKTNGIVIAKQIKLTPIYELLRRQPDSVVSSGNLLGSSRADYSLNKVLIRTDREEMGEVAIRNCDPSGLKANQSFNLKAIEAGTIEIGGEKLTVWDQGVPLSSQLSPPTALRRSDQSVNASPH